MPLVAVRWLDSGLFIADGWQQVVDVLEQARPTNMTVLTVGHLVHEDDDVLVVGLSYDEANDALYGAQVIARANVIEMRSL